MTVELLVENHWNQARWIDTPPRLSPTLFGDRWTRWVRLCNVGLPILTLVSLLILAWTYFILHLLQRAHQHDLRSAKNGVFARIALSAALFPAVQLGLFQRLLGERDLALMLVSTIVTTLSGAHLASRYAGRPPPPRWIDWALLPTMIVLFVLSGGRINGGWITLMLLTLVGVIVYLTRLIRAVGLWRSPELLAFVLCWGLVGAVSSFDFMTSLGFGAPLGGVQVACVSLLFFLVVQSFFLGRDHSHLVDEQLSLNRELGQRVEELTRRNREIEVLNGELRRKIGDRSRELGQALRRLRAEATDGGIEPGSVLADHYRVIERIGAGAMGEVYRVERLADSAILAAKVVRGRARPETLERFTREAELTARIDHENVVRVFDVDVTSDGEMFFVMELVAGRSLEQCQARFGDRRFACEVLFGIARALEAIHEGGVVHRDLKPANVLVSDGDPPHVKVADFGIARFDEAGATTEAPPSFGFDTASDSVSFRPTDPGPGLAETVDAARSTPRSPKLTEDGVLLGTPLYMAPEGVIGPRAIGPAADLFSVGLIAYQVLTGRSLLDPNRARRITPPSFRESVPELDPALADVLDRCLAYDPVERATAAELAAAIAATRS